MPPSLRRRANGVYFIDDRVNGERIRPILRDKDGQPVRDEHTARALLAQYVATVRPAIIADDVNDPDPTLRAVRDYYEGEFLPARNAAPKTIAGAAVHLDAFIRYCAGRKIGRVSQLSPRIIEGFSASLGRHPTTVKHYVATVRAMLNAAVASEVLSAHPISRWVMPKAPDPEHRPLTWPELRELVTLLRNAAAFGIGTPARPQTPVCPPWLFDAVYWIVLTGAPPADTCALTWPQCDLDTGWVTRNRVKVKSLRRYPLNPEAVALLRRVRAGHPSPTTGRVFLSDTGAPLTANLLYHRFVRAMTALGYHRHVTLYDLRHTFATLMANAKPPDVPVPLTTLQIMMGHSSITQTAYYVRGEGADAALAGFAFNLTGAPVGHRDLCWDGRCPRYWA